MQRRGVKRVERVSRRSNRAPIDIYLNKIVGDQPYLARTRDISESGMYLYKLLEPENVDVGGQIGLEFQLPGSETTIWAVGHIVRDTPAATTSGTSTDGIAIRFVRISPADRQLIRDYVTTAVEVVTHPRAA